MRLFYSLVIGGLLQAATNSYAQAPAWNAAATGSPLQTDGMSVTRATAVDTQGNVFITGYFSGSVAFGNTVLSSAGGSDLFVAKYVPGTNTWAWAQRGGGLNEDQSYAIAVSGNSVYLTGYVLNTVTNTRNVTFGGTNTATSIVVQAGATTTASLDLVVAKYTDNGASATFNWSQVAGGTGNDQGSGIAVSGTSVYVTGTITNSTTNANGVLFGEGGTTTGTVAQYGASATASQDIILAKYTDNGFSATLGWTQVAGGTAADLGSSVAVNGTAVYVTGSLTNTKTNTNKVLFGGTGATAGTVMQYGIGALFPVPSTDLVLAKYTDSGPTATLDWTQVAGGTGNAAGLGVAASGGSIYVTGTIRNNLANTAQVVFGGSGVTGGTVVLAGASSTFSQDIVLAKYTDNGATATPIWSQVAGGTSVDQGQALAVRGTSIYLTGYLSNNLANVNKVVFGGSGTTAGTKLQLGASVSSTPDIVVARYTDNGTSATLNWSQVGGGSDTSDGDLGLGIAVHDSSVYVGGYVGGSTSITPANGYAISFGAAAGAPLLGSAALTAVVGQLRAATGAWQLVAPSSNGGLSQVRATATDSRGNVFVTGNFSGQVTFGSTTLSSAGEYDVFVAKYVPGTNTWAWAQRGGGTLTDYGWGIAVSDSSVYVTGSVGNDQANTYNVSFGGTDFRNSLTALSGATTSWGNDIFLTKYTDHGTSATVSWTQVAGGTGNDYGQSIAVSGHNVYLVGSLTNNIANTNAVLFGGSGTVAGTKPQYGASTISSADLLVAKYTDNGATATFNWSQVGGGTGTDSGKDVAVNGSNVYVTGTITNTPSDTYAVLFGGTGAVLGTQPQYGIWGGPFTDLVLAKYTDNGTTATLGWTQVAGGGDREQAGGVAVSGNNVYMVGTTNNFKTDPGFIVFGGSGTTRGTITQAGVAMGALSFDLLLAKYIDNGASATVAWTQIAGGGGSDFGNDVAVSGSSIYEVV